MLLKNNILNNQYYIVRNGDFATCGNTKILYSMFAILLAIEDYFVGNSSSCFIIMIGSTIIWTIIEFILFVFKIRLIKPMYINFFNTKIELHKYLALFLQGFQEGGLITTIGLYFGDRLNNFYYMLIFHIFIIFSIINIFKKVNLNKSSRRQVNSKGSLGLMSFFTIFNLTMLYLYPDHIYRQIKMFFAMTYFCSFWTFFTWYKGFRTVETLLYDNKKNFTKKLDNNLDSLIVLGYDIIFEIGIAYLTFYNLFIILF